MSTSPDIFSMSDSEWKRIVIAGDLPEDDPGLRDLLNDTIDIYLRSVREFQISVSSKAINHEMRKIETLSNDLHTLINSHPQTRLRLAGMALFFLQCSGEPIESAAGRGRAAVDKAVQHVSFLKQMARMNLDLNPVAGDETWFPGHNTSDPPRRLFVSGLLFMWRFRLKREVKNWGSDAGAAKLTKFVHECLAVAGQSSPSIGATRKRIERVKGVMDKNESDGHSWSLFKPIIPRDS